MRGVQAVLVALALHGCLPFEPLPEPDCAERQAFYPDRDGDGLGEGDEVYVGCQAPDGWVSQLDTAPLDTASGAPHDTASTTGNR